MTQPTPETPSVQVAAPPDSRLAQLQAMYPTLKAASDTAARALKDCTDGIKLELTSAAPGHQHVDLVGANGCPTLQLDYRERWSVDSTRLKAEAPEIYVTYAKKSGAWYLNPAKDQS